MLKLLKYNPDNASRLVVWILRGCLDPKNDPYGPEVNLLNLAHKTQIFANFHYEIKSRPYLLI